MHPTKIKFSEWLPDGVVVQFTDGPELFFPSQYLWDRRSEQQAILEAAPDIDDISPL